MVLHEIDKCIAASFTRKCGMEAVLDEEKTGMFLLMHPLMSCFLSPDTRMMIKNYSKLCMAYPVPNSCSTLCILYK